MKTCSKCKIEYSHPTKNFHKKTDSPDGLQYMCKSCVKLFHKDHYQNNKEYYNEKAQIRHRKIMAANKPTNKSALEQLQHIHPKSRINPLACEAILELSDQVKTLQATVVMLQNTIALLEKNENQVN